MRAVGGREIHPVNVRVGGFYRAPTRRELDDARAQLQAARPFAAEAVAWTAALPFPEVEEDFTFVALRDAARYAIEGGRMVSTTGLDVAPPEFAEHVVEEQVPHSTALQARLRDGTRHLVGPLARHALNGDLLGEGARASCSTQPGCGKFWRNWRVALATHWPRH